MMETEPPKQQPGFVDAGEALAASTANATPEAAANPYFPGQELEGATLVHLMDNSQDWVQRLAFAKLNDPRMSPEAWWPVILHENCAEYDAVHRGADELQSTTYKARLCRFYMNEVLQEPGYRERVGKPQVVRFLGRPPEAAQQVYDPPSLRPNTDDEPRPIWRDFLLELSRQVQTTAFRPDKFSADSELYWSYHRGMDLACQILEKDCGNEETSSLPHTLSWLKKAQAGWDNYVQQHPDAGQAQVAPAAPPAQSVPPQASRSPSCPRPSTTQAANRVLWASAATMSSTNQSDHSVAAVSPEEDSSVATVATTPGSCFQENAPSQPLGKVTWREAEFDLLNSGWNYNDQEKTFHCTSDSMGSYSLEQFQQIAKEHYGWIPVESSQAEAAEATRTSLPARSTVAPDALMTPKPRARSTRQSKRLQTPESNTQNENEDPAPSSSSSESLSSASKTTPASKRFTRKRKPRGRPIVTPVTTRRTRRNTTPRTEFKSAALLAYTNSSISGKDDDDFYKFKYLMPILREDGWTYRNASNKLKQWVYERVGTPGEKGGVYGVDFFYEEDEVMEYCRKNNYKELYGNGPTAVTPPTRNTRRCH